jgi:hypothetical protein
MTTKEAWVETMMVLNDHDHKKNKRSSDGTKQQQPQKKED